MTDAPALAELVNRCYEVEKFVVEGARTNASEVGELVRSGTFLVLERGAELVAAVYVESRSDGGYIGMLSVDPAMQGMGLGTRLVRIAEAMCEAMGARSVRLKIINLREELARWYRSLGYREVGTAPFAGQAKQPCHFVEMQRLLAA